MSNWEKVGVIGVDAGLCWIGDPCYIASKDASNVFESWQDFCNQTDFNSETQQWNYPAGHAGLGVSVSSGHGDGVYEVFVRKTDDGLIKEAKVVFIEDGEEY